MRIIIAELDTALGLFLKRGLTVEGHQVSWTDHYDEAWNLVETGAPDLMVVDIGAEQGFRLMTAARQSNNRLALLALLRSNSVEERVRCLDLGADDCIAKPFSFQELTARCRALLRRQQRTEEIILTHGSLTLNRIGHSMMLDGQPVSLTAREFRLMEYLLQNTGRCCSRSELLTEVFQLGTDNATNVVDVYINYLRRKLSPGLDSPRIMTVRGAGYRLARAEHAGMTGRLRVPDVLRASA